MSIYSQSLTTARHINTFFFVFSSLESIENERAKGKNEIALRYMQLISMFSRRGKCDFLFSVKIKKSIMKWINQIEPNVIQLKISWLRGQFKKETKKNFRPTQINRSIYFIWQQKCQINDTETNHIVCDTHIETEEHSNETKRRATNERERDRWIESKAKRIHSTVWIS